MLVHYNTNSFFLNFSLYALTAGLFQFINNQGLSEIHFEISLSQVAP